MAIKKKLITIATKGSLSELGGILGPVILPEYVEISKVTALVCNRKKVYEVNPNNHSEKILLTIQNVNRDNFPPAPIKVKANVGPAPIPSQTMARTPEDVSVKSEDTVMETTVEDTAEDSEKTKDKSKRLSKSDFKKRK